MSEPRAATMADAILAQMDAATWEEAFDAERAYLERVLKTEAEKTRITAMIVSTERKNVTRGKRQLTHTISLGIRKNINPENVDAVDAMGNFAETIADYWDADTGGGRKVVSNTSGSVANVVHDPLYSPSDLDQNRQFFSVVTLTVIEVVNL